MATYEERAVAAAKTLFGVKEVLGGVIYALLAIAAAIENLKGGDV
jgi:hypothetical protein